MEKIEARNDDGNAFLPLIVRLRGLNRFGSPVEHYVDLRAHDFVKITDVRLLDTWRARDLAFPASGREPGTDPGEKEETWEGESKESMEEGEKDPYFFCD